MTNRDYLMKLNNEELANAIGRCHLACEETKCESIDCRKCCLKWLEKERETDVKKWQIRRDLYKGCFWLILYVNEESNWCMGVDEHGHISKMATDTVRFIWNVENKEDAVNKFLERIFENL